jgi:hypothetical protein
MVYSPGKLKRVLVLAVTSRLPVETGTSGFEFKHKM